MPGRKLILEDFVLVQIFIYFQTYADCVYISMAECHSCIVCATGLGSCASEIGRLLPTKQLIPRLHCQSA